ncbi:hypothetical protein OROMI_033936 [Orobanche minor]
MGIPARRGGDGGMVGVDVLSERAAQMREALMKSQSISGNMVSILGSFDDRLSALETAMRPTQIRTHAIRRAHENIDKTLKAAEVILSQFDLSRQDLSAMPEKVLRRMTDPSHTVRNQQRLSSVDTGMSYQRVG